MLKSCTFLEENEQKVSEEAVSTKMKAERERFLLEAWSVQLILSSFAFIKLKKMHHQIEAA